jgi:hypothetical protein
MNFRTSTPEELANLKSGKTSSYQPLITKLNTKPEQPVTIDVAEDEQTKDGIQKVVNRTRGALTGKITVPNSTFSIHCGNDNKFIVVKVQPKGVNDAK